IPPHHLWMPAELAWTPLNGRSNIRTVEARLNLLGRQRAEYALDLLLQRIVGLHPFGIRTEPFIVDEFRRTENALEEAGPLTFVLDGQDDCAGRGREWPVRCDGCMSGFPPRRRPGSVPRLVPGMRHPLRKPVEEGDLKTRAATCDLAPIERGEDA